MSDWDWELTDTARRDFESLDDHARDRIATKELGAVSKRCKNKWMRWTEQGLEALLNLRLLQYAHPARYEKRAAELIGMPTATAISLEVKSGGTRDKF